MKNEQKAGNKRILSIVLLKAFSCVIKKQIVEVFRNPQSYQENRKG
jgi:hypothetical protein